MINSSMQLKPAQQNNCRRALAFPEEVNTNALVAASEESGRIIGGKKQKTEDYKDQKIASKSQKTGKRD